MTSTTHCPDRQPRNDLWAVGHAIAEGMGIRSRNGRTASRKDSWSWPSSMESARWFLAGLAIAIAILILLGIG